MQKANGQSPERVAVIDILRGLSILLMILYHFGYDLVLYDILPGYILFNPLLDALQFFFSALFILLSGISSNFSRSNIKRGIYMLLAGCAVTAATYIFDPEAYVRFGILHFLGSAALIYGAGRKLFESIPRLVKPFIYAAGFILTYPLLHMTFKTDYFWMFGFIPRGFVSTDYFPILPYIFIFLLGTWAGWYVKSSKLPAWFYGIRCRPLSFVGRHTIWVYLAHQPVIIGLTALIKAAMN